MIDARLEAIVDRMLSRCFQDGQYRQALGIALETRRMDVFQKAIMDSVRCRGDAGGMEVMGRGEAVTVDSY